MPSSHLGFVRDQGDPSNQEAATRLRNELWGRANAAFGHLGDAAPLISEAEAFVRHNAHDCLFPHHEKDYRVLLSGFTLLVLRLYPMMGKSTRMCSEDFAVILGLAPFWSIGAICARGALLVPRWTTSSSTFRAVAGECATWKSLVGKSISSKAHPCLRCQSPQTPCRVGSDAEPDLWDPAAVPAPSPRWVSHVRSWGPCAGGFCWVGRLV